MTGGLRDRGGRQIEITGDLDRTEAEALALAIRRLARQCGVEVAELRIVAAPQLDVARPDPA